MWMAIALVQAVAGPVLPAAPRVRPAARCAVASDGGDVVVCARDNDSYRLKPLPARAVSSGPPQASMRIGNTKLAAEVEQASDGHFGVVNRAMLRLKIPLGGKKPRAQP